MLLPRKFEITKTSRELLLAALLPGAPDVVLRPTRSVPQFRGPWLLVGSWSCPPVKCTRSDGDIFLSRFVYPNFRPLQRLKVEVWTSAEHQRETNLKRLTSSADEALVTLV